jgi:antitoxin CptB
MLDETRLKRIRFRAWRRGFREADLILGPFADTHGPNLTPSQMEAFEILLELPDHDVYGWIVGRAPAPAEFDTELLSLLQDFHLTARLARGPDLGA